MDSDSAAPGAVPAATGLADLLAPMTISSLMLAVAARFGVVLLTLTAQGEGGMNPGTLPTKAEFDASVSRTLIVPLHVGSGLAFGLFMLGVFALFFRAVLLPKLENERVLFLARNPEYAATGTEHETRSGVFLRRRTAISETDLRRQGFDLNRLGFYAYLARRDDAERIKDRTG